MSVSGEQDRVEQSTSAEFGIIVGVDGSQDSNHALGWAIARSAQFGEVQPVTAWDYPWWMIPHRLPGPPSLPPADELQQHAEAKAREALDSTAARCCRPPIICQARPGPTLVTLGDRANLIVIGNRGRAGAVGTLLGSVSSHVASHATVPVAIVPLEAPVGGRPSRVVVGVDGSSNSIAALTWALRTTPDDVPIEAIHTWTYALSAPPKTDTMPSGVFERQARQRIEDSVAQATVRAGGARNEIILRLEHGDARHVLRRRTTDTASQLVVGARGHQGIAHLLVGSTTSSLIHQPAVTTVVVPAEATD